jgi:hypothetical protein
MTRLLLLGLSTFADDFGVLPLRPRTLRLQVFPGDAIDDDRMRALIGELATRGLVRRYTVEGVEYLSILDWAFHQRVGKRARRRYPADPSHAAGADAVAGVGVGEAGLPPAKRAPDQSKPEQSAASAPGAPPPSTPSAASDPRGETDAGGVPPVADEAADAAWRTAIAGALRRSWALDAPDDLARHAARWRAEGRDLARDVLPAVVRLAGVAVQCDRPMRLDLVDSAMVRPQAPASMVRTRANQSNPAL